MQFKIPLPFINDKYCNIKYSIVLITFLNLNRLRAIENCDGFSLGPHEADCMRPCCSIILFLNV